MDIFKLISNAKYRNASDLHLSAKGPPLIRVNGVLETVNDNILLTETDVQQACYELSSSDEMDRFRRYLELDFSHAQPDGTRLRCSIAQQRGNISLTIRILSPKISTIDELELPEIFKKLSLMEKGLIVVSGPTGSGKTTTQAAMIKHINMNRAKHILTFEDPIEYSHPNIKSRITQRELGGDTLSLAQALKHALRLDPDVIVVGEMRDSETAAAAISLAETGHLVITTSHAPYAAQTVERIIDLFPHEERHLAQMRLASLLSVVLCQTLVPRADGYGRIAAVEIMQVNAAIRNLIREGKITLLANAVRDYRQAGNTTLDEALVNLYHQGLIAIGTISAYCHDMDEVNSLLTEMMIRTKTLTSKLDLQNKWGGKSVKLS
jgi:twitching motility protein PilT